MKPFRHDPVTYYIASLVCIVAISWGMGVSLSGELEQAKRIEAQILEHEQYLARIADGFDTLVLRFDERLIDLERQ